MKEPPVNQLLSEARKKQNSQKNRPGDIKSMNIFSLVQWEVTLHSAIENEQITHLDSFLGDKAS